MRPVAIVGIGQLPVQKQSSLTLRQLGATAVRQALHDAGVDRVDALFAANMLADELQGQKQLAPLIADEAGLYYVEALDVGAATAGGAAALRMAYLAVAGGQADLALVVGVEKMSDGDATPVLAKSLDAEQETAVGATMLSQGAKLMRRYLDHYGAPADALAHFAVNAHYNAVTNPQALFRRAISVADVMQSRLVADPMRLLDCAPICDGAAAVLLAPRAEAILYNRRPVDLLASGVATDRFRLVDRANPLFLEGAYRSAQKVYAQAGLTAADVSFFELHDAFTIMGCLLLEAAGFAAPGDGWRLAAEGEIGRHGRIPITTLGGLKARGHPIGATAIYQVCEIVRQLTGRAGANQLANARIGLMQSVGGLATTVITHLFGASE